MGKRGPKPQGEFEGKSKVVSTRMTPETRLALEEAMSKSGRSLSQEIEMRLRRSFDEERRIIEIFGDRETYALLRTVGAAISMQNIDARIRNRHATWLSDPWAYDQAVKAALTIFEQFRPEGDPKRVVEPGDPSDEEQVRTAEMVTLVLGQKGEINAQAMLDYVTEAEGNWPVSPPSGANANYRLLAGRIKSNLGPLVDRLSNKSEDSNNG